MSGTPKIVIASPLQIVGAFLEITRELFSPDKEKPWVWDPDYATGTDLIKKPILIESMYVKANEARNFRPAVFIGRDTIPMDSTVIGDIQNIHNPTGTHFNFSQVNTSVRFLVESAHLGEAEIIAYDISRHFHYAKDKLVTLVANWKHVGPVQLLPPTISKKDARYTAVPISIGLQYELLWEVTPIAPRLQELFLRVQDMDDPNQDDHLRKTFYNQIEDE